MEHLAGCPVWGEGQQAPDWPLPCAGERSSASPLVQKSPPTEGRGPVGLPYPGIHERLGAVHLWGGDLAGGAQAGAEAPLSRRRHVCALSVHK